MTVFGSFFPKTCDLHFMPFKNRSNKLTSMHDLTFAKLNKIRRCEIFCWLHTDQYNIRKEIKYLIKVKISNIQLVKVKPNPDTLSMPAAN